MTDLGRYGDMAYFAVGPFRAYLVNNPDLLRDLVIAKSDLIQKLPYQRMVMGQIEGDGLLASEGEHWRRQRRLLQPAFHANRIAALADKAVRETMLRIESWRDGEPIDAIGEMTDLAMVIMAKSFFGLDINSEAPHFRAAMRHISDAFLIEMRTMVRLPRWLPTPKARRKWRAFDAIDEVIWGVVRRERGSSTEGDNLLAILLRAVDPENGTPAMTEKDARDETVTMFRSHDTTAAVLAWIICMLAHRPDVAEKIESEVATVIGERAPNAGDKRALAYTEMVVLETMRLSPPTWSLFTREAMQPFELGGYTIPRGSWLMAMPLVTHRDPRFFTDPPEVRSRTLRAAPGGRVAAFRLFSLRHRRPYLHRHAPGDGGDGADGGGALPAMPLHSRRSLALDRSGRPAQYLAKGEIERNGLPPRSSRRESRRFRRKSLDNRARVSVCGNSKTSLPILGLPTRTHRRSLK